MDEKLCGTSDQRCILTSLALHLDVDVDMQGIVDKFVGHNKWWGALKVLGGLAALQMSLRKLGERVGRDLVKWGK